MKNKIIAMIVVLTLVVSSLMVMTNVVAERHVEHDGYEVQWILSNNGFGDLQMALTCGEVINLQVVNNSLTHNQRYYVGVWNGDEWSQLKTVGTAPRADKYGDISIDFHVPGWTELGTNPLDGDTDLDDGQWNIALFKSSTLNETNKAFANMNITIYIGNLYDVYFTRTGNDYNNRIEHLIHGGIEAFNICVRNWTGDRWQYDHSRDDGIGKWGIGVVAPDGTNVSGFPKDGLQDDFIYAYIETYNSYLPTPINNYEYYYRIWLWSESAGDGTAHGVPIPVKLNMTATVPTNAKWGDTITVSGRLLNANGTGMGGRTFALFAPDFGGYELVFAEQTYGDGSFSKNVRTGSEYDWHAGTWYLGTYLDLGAANPDRLNEELEPPYIPGFIPYHSFVVGTKDTATVRVEAPDDVVRDFWTTINVSVANATWMDNFEFRNMFIHITGVRGWDGNRAYERSDIVTVNANPASWYPDEGSSGHRNDDRRSYYEFEYYFNETGTATIWASNPGDLTDIAGEGNPWNEPGNGIKSCWYGDRFIEANTWSGMIPDITGKTTLTVGSPGTFNVFVDDVPEEVKVDLAPGCGGEFRINATDQVTTISVFGDKELSHKNATITVTGAGLDFTIEEDDKISSETSGNPYLKDKGFNDLGDGAWYDVYINPKTAGTLTITVTNGTDSWSRDYTIGGLTGSVTTSIGDDLEITVGTTETITLTGVSEFAETTIAFFDENWGDCRRLNESEDAGEFSFTPDADDIDRIGYIVVVAGIRGLGRWMYEIIEVVPIDDLTVEVVSPDVGNRTLTVGLEQEVVVKILDQDGNPVTDDEPGLKVTLHDADGDEVELKDVDISWTEIGSGEWEIEILPYVAGELVIEGYNASEGIKHIGKTTLEVDYATITYSPGGTTAGIGKKDVTVDVSGVDANDNPLDGVTLYLWRDDQNHTSDPSALYEVLLTDGVGEFEIKEVGDDKAVINATLQSGNISMGNRTLGKFNIDYPTFTLVPETIYVGRANVVEVTAKDYNGNPLPGVNLTFMRDGEKTDLTPTPVKTDANGKATFSLNPSTSGNMNVTIIKKVIWDGGILQWDEMEEDKVVTDTVLTIAHIRSMSIAVSKSPIYQGETLTVTVTSDGAALAGVAVEFAGTTTQTGANGQATFTVPDPGVESAVYTITAEKEGYNPAERSITVIKIYAIQIIPPDEAPAAGEKFSVSIIARGQPLAGATVEFDGVTRTSGGDGKATFTAPTEEGTYTISASFEGYTPATITITIDEAEGVPGFELLALIAALGVAFILFKRRKRSV